MTSQSDFKKHLFRYNYDGKTWGFDIPATSREDAQRRLAAMTRATYDGELALSIPVGKPISRFIAWLRG